ncbi:hypothetical protein SAMN05443144_105145 [Fodinibius roseus]|uniref:ABM domain-containing protein n=1 Tax=Fodinibius roseus TaxID=1194090 RepID=A0A1M4YSR2_9BACT|nr:antibiotic biosynthesis monooxygenase [Fodinibius roseus]SHF08773.1 hypothetical protein SAMN05443144_105145 [Fodinibius roseus]
MIARIWHGITPAEKANEYLEFLQKRAIPDYERVNGCLKITILHRIEEEIAHFETLTFWTSEEAIKKFAGSEVLKAKYYPEDQDFLLEFEEHVRHYKVTKK